MKINGIKIRSKSMKRRKKIRRKNRFRINFIMDIPERFLNICTHRENNKPTLDLIDNDTVKCRICGARFCINNLKSIDNYDMENIVQLDELDNSSILENINTDIYPPLSSLFNTPMINNKIESSDSYLFPHLNDGTLAKIITPLIGRFNMRK